MFNTLRIKIEFQLFVFIYIVNIVCVEIILFFIDDINDIFVYIEFKKLNI